MSKRLILFTLPFALGLALFQPVWAMGGGWISNNQSWWRIEKLCRDGYTMTRVPTLDDLVPGNSTRPHHFGAEIDQEWFNESGVIDSFSGIDAHFAEYYGRLGPNLSIADYANWIADEVQINDVITRPGQYIGDFPFSQQLPVGYHVAFGQFSQVYDIWMVEDCYLHALDGSVDQAIDLNFYMNPGYESLDSKDIMVQIDRLPDGSSLALGNSDLTEGSIFTLASAQTSGMTFQASHDPAEADSVVFSVRGTFRVSLANDGGQIDTGDSNEPSISADGGAVSFTTEGTDLGGEVADLNGDQDVYLRKHEQFQGGVWTTQLVSRNSTIDGTGNGGSYASDLSPDGQFVTFVSAASDLVGTGSSCSLQADTNGVRDVFKWEEGGPFPDNWINRVSVFNFDNIALNCTEITEQSLAPSMADARDEYGREKVAFQTLGDFPNLVYGSDNGLSDILLDDRGTSRSQYVANDSLSLKAPNGRSYAADISADGTTIAFTSSASNLFAADTNGEDDVGIKGEKGGVIRVSIASDGSQAIGGDSRYPSISQLGLHIAFESTATNLSEAAYKPNPQIYVHDIATGCTQLLTKSIKSLSKAGEMGNGASRFASISADGRHVAFESTASDLIAEDQNGVSDIFVIDRDPDQNYSFYAEEGSCDPGPSAITRVSINGDGTEANGGSFEASLSANGDFVAFSSDASNLVSRDTNRSRDVFIHYIGYTGEIRFETAIEPPHLKLYLPLILR